MTDQVKIPKVSFRMNANTDINSALRQNYVNKFNVFMKEIMEIKMAPVDYEDLPKIRVFTGTKKKLEVMMEQIGNHLDNERAAKLLSVAPVFNHSPNDLKAFILLALGIRSFHLIEKDDVENLPH